MKLTVYTNAKTLSVWQEQAYIQHNHKQTPEYKVFDSPFTTLSVLWKANNNHYQNCSYQSNLIAMKEKTKFIHTRTLLNDITAFKVPKLRLLNNRE